MTEAPDGGPDKRRSAQERMLLDLGEDLRSVHTEVSGLRNDVRETAGVVSEAMPRLEELESGLSEVRGTVEGLTDAMPEVTNPPVEWPALSAEDAGREWEELAEWVGDLLVPWLQITRAQLPDVWPSYPRAVFELFWLRTCYKAAYAPTASPTAAAEWHTRWLDAALANVQTAVPPDWEQYAGQPASPAPGTPSPSSGGPAEPWKQPPQQPSYSYGGWRSELAHREHWEQALQDASARDLAWRRERDQRRAERARQTSEATSTDET